MVNFDLFKQILESAVKDPGFVRQNTILQNTVTAQDMCIRIRVLTNDYVLNLDWEDVINEYGALQVDTENRTLKFDPAAAGFALSNYKDAVIQTPGKFHARVAPGEATPSDGIRYLCADTTNGVVMLDEQLNVVTVFPNFLASGPTMSPDFKYGPPTAAITYTNSGQEYVAIAMGAPWNIVQIYTIAGIYVATLGTLNQTGSPPDYLSAPSALAYDPVSQKLFISCLTGMPTNAISNTGYVCNSTITNGVPGALVITGSLYTRSTGSLLQAEVSGPKALCWDAQAALLWIVNGNNEIAGVNTVNGVSSKFLPATTYKYVLNAVKDIKIRQTLSTKYLYIANSAYGNVVVIDLANNSLVEVYGTRAVEDNSTSVSSAFMATSGSVDGVQPDSVTVNGQLVEVVVNSDATNRRIQRIDEGAYGNDNICVFALQTFDVPISISGWAMTGDIPSDMVKLEYRFNSADSWHILRERDSVPPTQAVQFRVSVELTPNVVIQPLQIKTISILAKQS